MWYWTPPPWFLWLMRVLHHPSMATPKKKTRELTKPHELPAPQRYLFLCIGRGMEHAQVQFQLSPADFLRVLEVYRETITEKWLHDEPNMDGKLLSKRLGPD